MFAIPWNLSIWFRLTVVCHIRFECSLNVSVTNAASVPLLNSFSEYNIKVVSNSFLLFSLSQSQSQPLPYSNIYPTRCNVTQFIISGNCSTCFGWYHHPKHVEQFPDKINCVTLHLTGYILEYSYNAQTHKH